MNKWCDIIFVCLKIIWFIIYLSLSLNCNQMIIRMRWDGVAELFVEALDVPWVNLFPSPQTTTCPADPATISPEMRVALPSITGLKTKFPWTSFGGHGEAVDAVTSCWRAYAVSRWEGW